MATKQCRYRIVACIFLILSIFGFVLSAPVAVQEVREARTDEVDRGDSLKNGLGKRAEEEDSSLLSSPDRTPMQIKESYSAPNYASVTHPNPSLSSDSEGENELIQPGNSNIQPASSSDSHKAKSVSWAPSKAVFLPSGETLRLPQRPKVKEILPLPPGRKEYLTKMAAQQSPSPDIKRLEALPHTPFDLPLPPGRGEYLAKIAAQQSPLPEIKQLEASPHTFFDPSLSQGQSGHSAVEKSPPKGFFSDSTNILDNLSKLKFRPRFLRISRTVSSTVNAAQRELQGTVNSLRESPESI